MNNSLPKKGYARIYVMQEDHKFIVEDIIKSFDEYEYGYMNKNLVAVFNGEVHLVYNGKFDDICMDKLAKECMSRGFMIQVFTTGGYVDENVAWRYELELNKGLRKEGVDDC